MKTIDTLWQLRQLALGIVLVAAVGCGGKDKPKAKTTPDPTPISDKKPDEPLKKPEDVAPDQKVSPTLAVSADIIAACGLKVSPDANPNFDYDKDELAEEDRKVLEQIAQCLTTGALKGKNISLIGRADPRGTEEYNLGLGSRRASSVSKFLGQLGVGQPQMGVTTRGALDATGTDESSWQKDRRVDIQLASPAPTT